VFLRNAWYVAAWGHEVGRALFPQRILGQPLVLYRTADGTAVAFEDRCPHRRFALSKGSLQGDNIRCEYHGLVFNPDGKCVYVPGQPNIPPRMRVRSYPVVEKWQWLWVWMGEPEKADASLIPDFGWHDDPAWRPVGGHMKFGGHYQLVIDNLLDLTHETFVHQKTIGNAAVAETPMQTKVEEPIVRVERVMRDCAAPPLFRKVRGFTGNIDRWQIIRFEPPCHVVIDARGVPAGTNDLDRGLRWYVTNSITPETESSAHYFWTITRCFAQDDDAISTVIHDQIVATFLEDKDVIETQQQRIETDDPAKRVYDINADAGAVAARRIMSKLIAQESSAASA
jgi:phenylpropionate dioxygenase-like ring-hydroxylating dioxygenase large terminal subunit